MYILFWVDEVNQQFGIKSFLIVNYSWYLEKIIFNFFSNFLKCKGKMPFIMEILYNCRENKKVQIQLSFLPIYLFF